MNPLLRAWRPLAAVGCLASVSIAATASRRPLPPAAQDTPKVGGVSAPVQRATLALVGGTLIDGHGGAPIANSVVLVDGPRIVAVGRQGQLAVPAGVTVVSTEGQYVLPGLWDMHVHVMLVGHGNYAHWDSVSPPEWERSIIPAAAKQSVMNGVTSIRDLGGPLEEILAVRGKIDRGELVGATIYTSGPFLQHAPYPGTERFRWGISGPADARAKVKTLADAGVNVIKLIDQDQMTKEEIRAVVDEAHARKLPVVAHAHRPEEVRLGLEMGVDDFEHTGMQASPGYPDDVLRTLHERTAQGAKGPLWWTPTIDVLTNYTRRRDDDEYLDDPRWYQYLPPALVQDIRASLRRLDTLQYYRLVPDRGPTLQTKFTQLRQSGARLMIGTDAGVPGNFHGYATAEEMVTWVRQYGMDPMETIRAATFWPAMSLGLQDKVGTVSVGKTADIITVRENPLTTIETLRNVQMVIKSGKRVK